MDSYPDGGLGENILSFLKKTSIERLNEIFDKLILIDTNSKPTQEQIKECEKWTDLRVSNQTVRDWYCLLRNAQGRVVCMPI